MKRTIEKEKIARLAKWAKGEPQGPIRIDLEPTFGCNLKCKFCWQRDPYRIGITNYKINLSEERLLRLVDEAAALGVLEWQIAGGWEPMVKPEFSIKLMEKIKSHGMYGCLTTNGTLFTEERARKLVDIGWDQILFSLEGPNAEIHDELTGVTGSFEKSIQAMKWFRDIKKQNKQEVPQYSFHTVVTNKNYNQISELVKLGAELGVGGIGFESLNVWSADGEKIKLNQEQLIEFKEEVKQALAIAEKLGIHTTLGKFLDDERLSSKGNMDEVIKSDVEKIEKKAKELDHNNISHEETLNSFFKVPCFEPFTSMEIRASGHVVECRLCDYQDDAPMLQNLSLKEVWHGPYLSSIRQGILDGKLPKYCNTCAAGIVVDMRKLREEMLKSERNLFKIIKQKILGMTGNG